MILFLDCSSGISGDMLAGALLELAGADGGEALTTLVCPALAAVGLDTDVVTSAAVRRGGVAARAFSVAELPGFATFAELVTAVRESGLPTQVTEAVAGVAERMAGAEERVHGGEVEHLHELAGVDTIVDLLAAAVLLDHLAPQAVLATPPALGSGVVHTAHGTVGVPAPAVLELLKGWPVAGGQGAGVLPLGELTTPTGAALLVHYARPCPALPAGRIARIGCGAGRREVPDRPNVLRAVLLAVDEDAAGESPACRGMAAGQAEHVLLETNIDDMTPELLAHAAAALLAAGALDVWLSEALMKKGRPGAVLHVLSRGGDAGRLSALVFRETSSFGLRLTPVERVYADERRVQVDVEGETIGVRLGYVAGRLVTVSPEYEDVRRAAAACDEPAKAIHQAAQTAARRLLATD
jgi:uncharacterized protein (TIGR00299 family) protein